MLKIEGKVIESKTTSPVGSQRNAFIDLSASMAAGIFGRVITNNMTTTLSNIQNGLYKPDLKISTLRACLAGSALQTSVAYSVKEKLSQHQVSMPPAVINLISGALGGLAFHPSAIRLFLLNSRPEDSGGVKGLGNSSLKDLNTIWEKDPKIFARALPARVLFSSVEWGLFLTIKDLAKPRFHKTLNDSDAANAKASTVAATVSTVVSTPVYQVYISQISTGASLSNTVKTAFNQKVNKAISLRVACLSLGFSLVSILEKIVVDCSYDTLKNLPR